MIKMRQWGKRKEGDEDPGIVDFSSNKREKLDTEPSTSGDPVLDETQEEVRKQHRETKKMRQHAIQELKRAKWKKNIMFWNSLISTFGTDKQFGFALTAYADLKESGVAPTVYTFTNLVNAAVRCGETQQARDFVKEMKTVGVPPNEVTYTALLKGLCGDGCISEARDVMKEMTNVRCPPNIRTYDTFIRGCWRSGFADDSLGAIKEMRQRKIAPDASTFEYTIKALAQSFRLDEAWGLVKEAQDVQLLTPSTAAALATACALRGDKAGAERACDLALSAMDAKIKEPAPEGAPKGSVGLFLKLRTEEVEKELARVKAYIRKCGEPLPVNEPVTESSRVMFLPEVGRKKKKYLKMKKIFGNKKPVRLEICSGHGEWIVERSSKDPESNWVGLEMRFERVYQIWSKMKFESVPNMLVLGGEGYAIISQCFASEKLAEVFVNFPDPPVWNGSKQKLITAEFLKEVHRILRDDGHFTFVTDDATYAMSTVKEIGWLPELFKSEFAPAGFSTQLPTDYGSSYFDRFWINGSRTRRYYLKYAKIPTATAKVEEMKE